MTQIFIKSEIEIRTQCHHCILIHEKSFVLSPIKLSPEKSNFI